MVTQILMENSNDNIYTEARLKIFQCESWECKQLNMIYKQCWKVSQINNQTKNILNLIIILMLESVEGIYVN